ncbi:hypothetical protein MMC22_008346 [Lobaria immixta]|nr:hypothetical protein [Lobaria immixta]
MLSLPEWYQADNNNGYIDPAQEAFEEAKKIFSLTITNDARKLAQLQQATCLEDVQRAVIDAKSRYDTKSSDQKATIWLSKFSSRVRFYSNIMDVLVQHHPEYVSLAWGDMKFLFVLVANHENMVRCLTKGLCQITYSLPRIQLVTVLYPTARMKQAVSELYAHIIRFFIRAHDWYQESKSRHFIHSLTRPVELRYSDVIDEIESSTRAVDTLATAGAQAEQRDVHLKLQELDQRQKDSKTVLLEIRQMMITHQSINSSAHLNTNQRLSDLQVSQIVASTSNPCKMDAMKSLQYCVFMRKQLLKPATAAQPFWLTPRFQTWKSAVASSLVIVKGNYATRFEVKDFCVNAVTLLRSAKIPVIWALKTVEPSVVEAPSAIDLLKDLTSQALRLNIALHNERSLVLSCTKFLGAESENDWFDILAGVLAGLPQIYILIDIEAVNPHYQTIEQGFSWPSAFLNFFGKISERGLKTVVKVVLVSYGSAVFRELSQKKELQDLVITVGQPQTVPAARRRRISSIHGATASMGKGIRGSRTRGLSF